MKTTSLKSILLLSTALCLFSNIASSQILAAGTYHSLYICPNANLPWAWGYNSVGQIGDGSTTNRFVPVHTIYTNFSGGVFAIPGGAYHSLAIRSIDSSVWAWGDGNYGALGNGAQSNHTSPVEVLGNLGSGHLTGIVAISAGDHHSLAVKSDGTVWAWGRNISGQLGDGNYNQSVTPVQVHGLAGNQIIAVAAGGEFSLALDNAGNVYGWGNNGYGQLGVGLPLVSDNSTPVSPFIFNVKAIAAGEIFSMVLKNDSTVWTFGDNMYGELGEDSVASSNPVPIQVVDTGCAGHLTGIIAIAACNYHAMALKYDGTVYGWGDGTYGDIGDGYEIQRNCPVRLDSLSGITNIALGGNHGLALQNNGTLWSWGWNDHGQCGDNTQVERDNPVKVKYLCSSLSVPQLSLDESVGIYPNPFSSSTTITFGELQEHTSITITDVLGNEIKTIMVNGTNNLTIDKGTLANGIYFLQIKFENNSVLNRKIVIQ